MKSLFRPLIVVFVVLVAVTGLAYPAVMTVFGQAVFPRRRTAASSRRAAGSWAPR